MTAVTAREVSQGIDPVQGYYNIAHDSWLFWLGRSAVEYVWREMPFTLLPVKGGMFADRDLLVKHLDKAMTK